MILIDTSIWVDHARQGIDILTELLAREEVLSHPFVIGELALGGFTSEALQFLSELPQAVVATNDEVLELIDHKKFAGRGIGYVDAHLLASALLTGHARVWTRDKRMLALADDLDVLATFAPRPPS